MPDQEKYPWTIETMRLINELTPIISGYSFDPDWFLLRQRFEEMEDRARASSFTAEHRCAQCGEVLPAEVVDTRGTQLCWKCGAVQ